MTWFTRRIEGAGRALSSAGSLIATFFDKDLRPILLAFLKQFATDIGRAALVAAAGQIADVKSGKVSVPQAGKNVLSQLESAGVNIAIQDATTIAMNAIRVYLPANTTPSNPLAVPPDGVKP